MGYWTSFEHSRHLPRQRRRTTTGFRSRPFVFGRRRDEGEQPGVPVSPFINFKKMFHVSHLPVLLGLFGGAVVGVSADAPLIHMPIVGTISYLHHPGEFISCRIGELVILSAAGLSIVASLLRRFKLLWLTGAAVIAQLVATVATFRETTAEVVAKADRLDLVDPTLMWAGAVLKHAHFEWGVAMVAVGAMMVLAAAAWELERARRNKEM